MKESFLPFKPYSKGPTILDNEEPPLGKKFVFKENWTNNSKAAYMPLPAKMPQISRNEEGSKIDFEQRL